MSPLLLLAGCAARHDVHVEAVFAPAPPLELAPPALVLPRQVDGAATVVSAVEGMPARVYVGGTLGCAETPCALAVPEGPQVLVLERPDDDAEDDLTVPGDQITLDVVRGERLFVAHRMSERTTSELRSTQPYPPGARVAGGFLASFAAAAFVTTAPSWLGEDPKGPLLASVALVGWAGLFTTVLMAWDRPAQTRVSVRPAATTIRRDPY